MDCGKLLKILVHALVIAIVTLFLLLVAMYCNGCGKQSVSAPLQYEGRMKYAGTSGTLMEVWIDTETGICYLSRYRGGIVVMVDHDGKPYIANGWRDFDE